MKVSVTQFSTLARDSQGNVMPLGNGRLACEVRTADGAFAALQAHTKFIRVATDTAIHIDIDGGAVTAADELMPANSTEFFAVDGGETINILTA